MADSAPSSSDRLSDLPEHILLHILSFLPTKDTVAASVLSKPWQHLWTLVPSIDHYIDGSYLPEDFDDSEMISKVLDGNKAPIIRRFRLQAEHFCTSSLNEWVSSATQRNLEELDLDFYGIYEDFHRRPFTFAFCCAPESRKTLVVMKLKMHGRDLQFVIGGHLDFPRLKVLHTNMVSFETLDPSLSGFFPSRFPLLEELVVRNNTIHHDINISLPILRRLKMYCFPSEPIRKYTLYIEAPSLQYLALRGFRSGGFRVEHLPNLVEANVDVFHNIRDRDRKHDEYGESLIDFVNAMSDVTKLNLSLRTMMSLSSLHADRIQPFHNLVELDLELCGSVLCITMIMLSKFKNLLHLKVTTRDGPYNRSEYVPPEHVPNCLTYHLKTFCIRYFQGTKYEIELTAYILKNSLVLENAKIRFDHCLTWAAGCHIHTILSTTSKGSLKRQLQFDQISELEHRNHKDRDCYD